jgi:hypothetical protein
MKTKLKLLALVCALTINAGATQTGTSGFQGELGLGYTSDYYFRGGKVSDESTQIQAKLSTDIGVAGAYVSAFANQGLQSADSYQFAVGLSKSYGSIDMELGYLHLEDIPGDARGELFVSLGLDTVLSPSVTINQDLDDSLTSGELELSHTIDIDVADLTITGVAGVSDTLAGDTNYYEIGGSLNREFGSLVASLGVDYVDAENVDSETVFSAGIGIKF